MAGLAACPTAKHAGSRTANVRRLDLSRYATAPIIKKSSGQESSSRVPKIALALHPNKDCENMNTANKRHHAPSIQPTWRNNCFTAYGVVSSSFLDYLVGPHVLPLNMFPQAKSSCLRFAAEYFLIHAQSVCGYRPVITILLKNKQNIQFSTLLTALQPSMGGNWIALRTTHSHEKDSTCHLCRD